jgi:hypothetical protein
MYPEFSLCHIKAFRPRLRLCNHAFSHISGKQDVRLTSYADIVPGAFRRSVCILRLAKDRSMSRHSVHLLCSAELPSALPGRGRHANARMQRDAQGCVPHTAMTRKVRRAGCRPEFPRWLECDGTAQHQVATYQSTEAFRPQSDAALRLRHTHKQSYNKPPASVILEWRSKGRKACL